MSKRLEVAVSLAIPALLACGGLALYALSSTAEVIQEVEIAEGEIAGLSIGSSRSAVLSTPGLTVTALASGKGGCTTGWVLGLELSQPQEECLSASRTWGASSAALSRLCPESTDSHAELFFSQGRLAKVRAWCTRPL